MLTVQSITVLTPIEIIIPVAGSVPAFDEAKAGEERAEVALADYLKEVQQETGLRV